MPETPKPTPSVDEIADMASRGEDISAYFSNEFSVVRPPIDACTPESQK
jgi:hypothetical protein